MGICEGSAGGAHRRRARRMLCGPSMRAEMDARDPAPPLPVVGGGEGWYPGCSGTRRKVMENGDFGQREAAGTVSLFDWVLR